MIALLTLYTALFTGLFTYHPVHISVSNAEIRNNTLEMTLRSFRDDLQTAYFHYHGKEIDYTRQENLRSTWLTDYLKQSLIIVAFPMKDTLDLEYVSARLDEDAVVFEFKAGMPDQAKSLYIYNGFLLDIYADQSNLMIFGISGSQRGMKFDAGNREQELKLKQ